MLQLRAGRDGLGIPILELQRAWRLKLAWKPRHCPGQVAKIDDYLADNVSFVRLSYFRLEVN